MTAILRSLKADLLDRRLLPILVALGVLLAGAIAYVVLAGGSGGEAGAPAPAARTPSATSSGPNVAVTQAPANPHAAVAETTVGGSYQHKAGTRDPFGAVVRRPAKVAATATKSTASGASTTPTTSSSSSKPSSEASPAPAPAGGGGTTPSKPTAPKPKKHKVEEASVLFGPAPAPGQPFQVTPSVLKVGGALPSSKDPLVVFAGLDAPAKPQPGTTALGGERATFKLTREAIVNGPASCRPSSVQCESIILALGQSEELSYLEETGQTTVYQLTFKGYEVHEATVTATAASRRHHRHHR